jgi:hypothetical protein
MLILSTVILFSCASKPRGAYLGIKTVATMNDTIEVQMVPAKSILCVGKDGKLVSSCVSKDGTRYFKIGQRKEASEYIYKLAMDKCDGRKADRIGERISREYEGNSSFDCFSNGRLTSCSGTSANYSSGYISTWKCRAI